MPALLVDTGVGASPEANMMSEGGFAAATVRFEVVDWPVAAYKARYVDCQDALQLSDMFSDNKYAIMYDRRVVNHGTDIGGWNHRCQVLQSYCRGYMDHVGSLDMPMVDHDEESNYVPCLVTLLEHADTPKSIMGLEGCCVDMPYNGFDWGCGRVVLGTGFRTFVTAWLGPSSTGVEQY